MLLVAAAALAKVGSHGATSLATVALEPVMVTRVAASNSGRDGLGRALFASVAVGVLFATLNGLRPVGPLTVSDVAFVAALALAVITLLTDPSSRHRVILPWWLIAASAGLLASGLLIELFPPGHAGTVGSPDPFYASVSEGPPFTNLTGVLRLVATLVVVILVITFAADSPHRVHALIEMWIAGALAGALVGILDHFGLSLGEMLTGDVHRFPWVGREAGLSVHPTTLGLASAMTLPMVIVRVAHTTGRRRLCYLAVIAFLIGALVLSGSRSGVIGAAFGVVFVLVLDRDLRRVAGPLMGVALVLIIAFSVSNVASLPTAERFTTEGGLLNPSSERRVEIGKDVWSSFKERPFVGYGFQHLRGAHNTYLQLLQAGGAIGLVAFLLFAGSALGLGLRSGRSPDLPTDLRDLTHALTASIVVWLISGLMLLNLLDRFLYVPLGLLLVIAVPNLRGEMPSSPHANGRSRQAATRPPTSLHLRSLQALNAVRRVVLHPSWLPDTLRGAIRRRRRFGQEFFLLPYRDFFVGEVDAIAAVTGRSGSHCRAVRRDVWIPLDQQQDHPLFGGRPELVRIAAATVRLMKPARVVETGVAQGVTSAAILDAMERNGDGHLYSIDLPVLYANENEFVGCLVSDRLQARWILRLGPSRKLLKPLLTELGSIDIFLHDADHSYQSQLEEYSTVWPFLRPGGVLISDDIGNPALLEFAAATGIRPFLVGHPTGSSAVGLLRKPHELS